MFRLLGILLILAPALSHAKGPLPPPALPVDIYASALPTPDSCQPYDLRTTTLSGTVPRDQGSASTCYAVTAAGLIDAWRSSHRPAGAPSPTPVSDEHLAAMVDLVHHRPVGAAGGFVCEAYRLAQQRHLCLESAFPAGFGVAEARRLSAALAEIHGQGRASSPEAVASRTLACLDRFGFDLAQSVGATEITRMAGFTRGLTFSESVLTEVCSSANRIELAGLPSCTEVRPDLPVRGYRELSRALDASPTQPVGIGYCSAVLYEGAGTRQVDWTGEGRAPRSLAGCGPHASIVIGRRTHPSTGRCQVLIRNSQGPTCSFIRGYASEWDCAAGDIWVDLFALSLNLTEIESLTP